MGKRKTNLQPKPLMNEYVCIGQVFIAGEDKGCCSGALRDGLLLGQRYLSLTTAGIQGRQALPPLAGPGHSALRADACSLTTHYSAYVSFYSFSSLTVGKNHNSFASCLFLGEVVYINHWQTTCKDFLPCPRLLPQSWGGWC